MKKLVIFSGAGMSAESGINTFRDSNGLWEKYDVRDVATPEAWEKNPQSVQQFYNERRKQIIKATPNLAHQVIAQLESDFDITVITQNIDDLHERAGSKNVLHLHGNIRLAKSSAPNAQYSTEFYPISGWELNFDHDKCPDGYPLRPHVVWFGETVPEYDHAVSITQQADIFIVIGTTLTVYPVAALVNEISADCNAFYIDPKANEAYIPSQYKKIKMTASEGLLHLNTQILNQIKK